MDSLDKTFLVSLTNLNDKVRANDDTAMAEVSFIKSYSGITDELKAQIYDIMSNIVDDETDLNKGLVSKVLSEFVGFIPDGDFLYEISLLPKLQDGADMSTIKDYVNQIINSTTIPVATPAKQFTFYSKCVYLAILTKDSGLIKQTIDKIQSL